MTKLRKDWHSLSFFGSYLNFAAGASVLNARVYDIVRSSMVQQCSHIIGRPWHDSIDKHTKCYLRSDTVTLRTLLALLGGSEK